MDTLFHDPRHPYTRLLFAATPDLAGEQDVLSIPGAPPRLDRPILGCPFEPRCDRAFDPCKVETPALLKVGAEHQAACHLNDASFERPATGRLLDERRRRRPAPTRDGTLLLDVHDLVVQYPVRRGLTAALRREPRKHVSAVDGVSLSVRPGEMLALIGESGCGKTSTAQAILRMVDATSGTIEVDGRDITHLTSKELRPIRRTHADGLSGPVRVARPAVPRPPGRSRSRCSSTA